MCVESLFQFLLFNLKLTLELLCYTKTKPPMVRIKTACCFCHFLLVWFDLVLFINFVVVVVVVVCLFVCFFFHPSADIIRI